MTVKPWAERLNEFPDMQITTSTDVQLAMAAEIQELREKVENLKGAIKYGFSLQKAVEQKNGKLVELIRKVHKAKGRYHTQIAMCDLFDAVGLPNERPKK